MGTRSTNVLPWVVWNKFGTESFVMFFLRGVALTLLSLGLIFCVVFGAIRFFNVEAWSLMTNFLMQPFGIATALILGITIYFSINDV